MKVLFFCKTVFLTSVFKQSPFLYKYNDRPCIKCQKTWYKCRRNLSIAILPVIMRFPYSIFLSSAATPLACRITLPAVTPYIGVIGMPARRNALAVQTLDVLGT